MRHTRRSCLAALLLLAQAVPDPALAASLSARETSLLGQVLKFLEPRPTGDGVVVVAYAAGDTASQRDAQAIVRDLGAGVPTQDGVLRPVVASDDALGAMRFGLVIAAAGAASAAVLRAALAQHALCVTGDAAAVRAGLCAMAIGGEPRIEILLNHTVVARSGIRFATAFRMMVHDI